MTSHQILRRQIDSNGINQLRLKIKKKKKKKKKCNSKSKFLAPYLSSSVPDFKNLRIWELTLNLLPPSIGLSPHNMVLVKNITAF